VNRQEQVDYINEHRSALDHPRLEIGPRQGALAILTSLIDQHAPDGNDPFVVDTAGNHTITDQWAFMAEETIQ
jgi:hypothetical protein